MKFFARTHFLSGVSVVLLAGFVLTQPASAGWADSLFDEMSKNFGDVPHGQILTHTFRIKNTTPNPVTISALRVSCGCVSAVVNSGTLATGQETTLVAKMDTSRFDNVRTVTIFVTFGTPAFDEVRLTVSANSRTDFAVQPEQLVFGTIKRGSGTSSTVTLTFFGQTGAKITEVKAESNYIKTTVQEVKRPDGATAFEVR